MGGGGWKSTGDFKSGKCLWFALKAQNYISFKAGDSGLYECQVSTTPILSHYVYLKVAGAWRLFCLLECIARYWLVGIWQYEYTMFINGKRLTMRMKKLMVMLQSCCCWWWWWWWWWWRSWWWCYRAAHRDRWITKHLLGRRSNTQPNLLGTNHTNQGHDNVLAALAALYLTLVSQCHFWILTQRVTKPDICHRHHGGACGEKSAMWRKLSVGEMSPNGKHGEKLVMWRNFFTWQMTR